jgi:hypothetical protein
MMTIDELRKRLTIDVPTAGEVLGVSRDNAYAAARAGSIPTLHVGRRLVVPVAAFLRTLGVEDGTERPTSDD